MIGRREELARLRDLLGGNSRLVTIAGGPGIGKSRLAEAAAGDVERAYPGGVGRVQVGELADAALLPAAAARALQVHLDRGAFTTTDLAAALGDRRALLVLDGCDRHVDACGRLLVEALAGTPALTALATSRQPLGVPGEMVLRLGPLRVPDPDEPVPDPERLAAHEGVALFLDRAVRAVPTFRLNRANAGAVARLCAALGGVPLALELAAARLTVLSPHGLLERMDDRYRVLTRGEEGAPAHLRSLRASVDLSHDLCSPQERLLWARTSVFPGSFDLDAAEEVCSGGDVDRRDVLDLVDGLLQRSVLAREDTDPRRVRYRLPEELRLYGDERLTDEERERLRDGHLAWCVRMVGEVSCSWFGGDQAALVDRLRHEHANLAAALTHATVTGATDDALRLVVGLRPLWMGAGRVGEARHWLDQVLPRPCGESGLRVEALLMGCWFALFQGDADRARAGLQEATALAAAHQVPLGASATLVCGALQVAAGQLSDGITTVEGAMETARAAADTSMLATGLLLVGMLRGIAGDVEGAASALRRCVRVTEAVGEQVLRSFALGLIAVQALAQGEPGIADEAARQALRMKVELGDTFATTCLLDVLACVAADLGDGERAATIFGAAGPRWQRLRTRPDAMPLFGPLHVDGVARVRTLLGSRRFEARCRFGSELTEDQVIGYALEGRLGDPADEDASSPLSARELEVARLVGQGLSNRDIARRLVISPRTAQGHVENILRKLGFASRSQVAAWIAARDAGHGRHG